MNSDNIYQNPILMHFLKEHPQFRLTAASEIKNELCDAPLAVLWINNRTDTIMFKQTFTKLIYDNKENQYFPVEPKNIVPLSHTCLNKLYSDFYVAYKKSVINRKKKELNHDFR